MRFKIVRVDATEPYKVTLPLGSHLVGRGKFLDCNDNRVSRNHAELIVTSDSILLKSLHQNPCFVKKKSSTKTLVFSQPESQVLTNGDQFGLIPDNFWYEVIFHLDDSSTEHAENEIVINKTESHNLGNEDTHANGNSEIETQSYGHVDGENDEHCSQSMLAEAMLGEEFDSPFNLPQEIQTTKEAENESENQPAYNPENMDTTAEESTHHPCLTNNLADSTNDLAESANQLVESTTKLAESTNQHVESSNSLQSNSQNITPSKRAHSENNSPCDLKRVKTELEEPEYKDSDRGKTQLYKPDEAASSTSNQTVKAEPGSTQNPMPGTSNDQVCSSSDGGNIPPAPAMPPSPTKPPNKPLRERCMYGANCYRRNPQHKAQFSHPSDADWGSGPQGVCPWGAGCLKTDPRHWRDHQHPPGVLPPQQAPRGNRPGMRVVRRHGNIFYINANSVHFYEEHVEVEDSDGDSVDYDYEF